MPPLSEADLHRLERERAEADRQYNDALTRLDAALVAHPALPSPPPPIDQASAKAATDRWPILADAPPLRGGLRGRLARFVRGVVAPFFDRQQHFNQAIVEHLHQQLARERQAREALAQVIDAFRDHTDALVSFQSTLIQYAQQITPYVDTKDRALAATVLRDPHEQSRALEGSIGMLQQQVAVLKRELQRAITSGVQGPASDVHSVSPESGVHSLSPKSSVQGPDARRPAPTTDPGRPEWTSNVGHRTSDTPRSPDVLTAYKYLGFEDQFRGSPDEIRARMASYVPLFAGASDVLDVGCGRGELLDLLRERGVSGRGLELNHEMVEVCRARGLDVVEGDAVGFLEGLRDGALGGLFAGQVVEHLEADYLLRFLELAYLKLRPGSKIILETINVDSWSAFFGPYLRDITHVHPLPPATLAFLLRASGFQRVETRASAPMGDEAKLARLPLAAADAAGPQIAPLITAFNQNVDRLNELFFGFIDYAAIGERL
jgi:O-antigen chain-terminating methyltransferase